MKKNEPIGNFYGKQTFRTHPKELQLHACEHLHEPMSNLAFGVGMIVIPALFPFGLRIRHLRILSPAVFSTILIVGGVLLLFFTWRSMRNARTLKAAGGKITVDGPRVTYPEVEKGTVEYRSFLTTDIEYVKDDEEEHNARSRRRIITSSSRQNISIRGKSSRPSARFWDKKQ